MENENIPIYEQIIFILIFYVISFLIAYFTLLYLINKKIVSKILFRFCLFYFSLFLFCQFIIFYDLLLNTIKDKLIKEQIQFSFIFIQYFYTYFNYFSLFLRYVLFPFYIGFSKSGYVTTWKKVLDAIFYHYIKISIVVSLIIIGIIIFIIFDDVILDFYGNYGSLIRNYLNFLSLIEVYYNVGFFVFQNFFYCKRKFNKNINFEYSYNFRKRIEYEKNNNIEILNKAYKKFLVEMFKTNLKNTKIYYFQNISLLVEKAKENNDIYKINFEEEKNNKLLSSDKNDNNNLELNNNEINNEENENEINKENNDKNQYQNNNYYIKMRNQESIQIKKDINKIEKELSPYVREFKKAMRKIPKSIYLKEQFIDKSYIKKTICQKILSCLKQTVFFIATFLILIFEMVCLGKKEYNKERKLEENNNKTDTFWEFIMSIFITFGFIILNSSYTIAVFYSLYNRRIITGDLLYGKHLGDNISLIETTKTISGFAFVLSYCNLFIFFKTSKDNFAIFFEVIIFPDYEIGNLSFLGTIKLLLIFILGIFTNSFEKIFSWKINDHGNVMKYFCKDNNDF